MKTQTKTVPRLLVGERLATVKNIAGSTFADAPSSVKELYRLAKAETHGEVGDFGPVMASQVLGGSSVNRQLRRYEAIFGRDSLRVAMDLLDEYPKLARSTLLSLAELQGVAVNIAREEEPGRIIHESRNPDTDPIAIELKKRHGWDWPYYGSVDATVEFVRTLAAYCRNQGMEFLNQTYIGRDGAKHSMADALTAAVGWIISRLDANTEGLLEFKRMSAHGLENQAWKDSWDSYFHADGTIANHKQGIASIEVQRVTFDALNDAMEFYKLRLGREEDAKQLKARAEKLRRAIMQYFWCEERGGYFVLGTDRDGSGKLRQLKIMTSNMGHMLRSPTLLSGDNPEIVAKREAVIRHLFSPAMLNQSGIRTLATTEHRYRPGAYHNGSVWLWDNYLILQGLDEHGYHRLAKELESRVKNVVTITHQFPEFVRGDDNPEPQLNTQLIEVWDEKNNRMNILEQPPQEVQAWSVAAIISIDKSKKVAALATTNAKDGAFESQILRSLKH